MAFGQDQPGGLEEFLRGKEELLNSLRGGDPGATPPPGLMMPGQTAAPQPPPQVAQPAPPPTDDPGLAMPPIPKPPDLSNSPLAQLLTRTNQDQAAIAAVPKPDPAQLKPRLWERILGGVLGATQLVNPERAGDVADSVVHRRLNGAQRDYDVKTSPLYKQLETDRQGVGLAEAQSRIPQQTFDNDMKVSQEKRAQQLDTGRIGQYRARATSLEGKFIAGTEEKDENSPTGWTAETAQGERKPFTPKASASSATPHTVETADGVMQYNPETQRYDIKVGAGKKKGTGAAKPANKSQFRLIETRKQASLAKAEHEYAQNVSDTGGDYESKESKQALELLNKQKEQIQSAYEAEIEAAGGNVSDGGSGPAPAAAGKPAAAAASASPDPSLWKDKNARLVTRDKTTGAVQKWVLKDGKPVMVSEEKNGNRR